MGLKGQPQLQASRMIPPRRIALSGGGMKGIAHIGALEVLQSKGLLKHVNEYLGTSAGALISLCLVIGYSLSELNTLSCVFDFSQTQNLELDTMIQCIDILGFDDGRNVEKFLSVLIRAKGLPDTITFEEFYRRRPSAASLRVFATDLNTMSSIEFSKKTPRVSLSFAVRASMTIPLIFTPLRHPITNHIVVDGALVSHFPFYHMTDEERKDAIGIAFNINSNADPNETPKFIDYIMKCYMSTYKDNDRELFSKWNHRIINIECDEHVTIKFYATKKEKEDIINTGRNSAIAYFSRAYVKPLRRYSLP